MPKGKYQPKLPSDKLMNIVMENYLHPALLSLLIDDDETLFLCRFPEIGRQELRFRKDFIKRTTRMQLISSIAKWPNSSLLKIIERLEDAEDAGKPKNIVFEIRGAVDG